MRSLVKLSGIAVLLTLTSQAYAWDCNYWEQHSNPKAECYKAPVDPNPTSTSTASQHQGQGQAQTAQGGAGGTGGAGGQGLAIASATNDSHAQASSDSNAASQADNAGNNQTTEFNSNAPRMPVNTAIAGFQITNAPCRYSEGVGIQTSPVGASVGFTFKDKDCERFQYAQYLYYRGQTIAGARLMCRIKRIKEALGEDCEALMNEITVVKAEYPPGERERRIKAHGGNPDK